MITYSQIFDFTYVNQLPKISKVRKWRNFEIVSRFSSYFATNRTRARNAISTSQLFTSSVYRLRKIMTSIVLILVILIAVECDYKP